MFTGVCATARSPLTFPWIEQRVDEARLPEFHDGEIRAGVLVNKAMQQLTRELAAELCTPAGETA